MASLLTTIYAEVVKTAAIRKFSHASNERLVFARFALFAALTFGVLFTWDFAETANL